MRGFENALGIALMAAAVAMVECPSTCSAQFKGVAYDLQIGDLVLRIPAQVTFATSDRKFDQDIIDKNARGPAPVRRLNWIAFLSAAAWPVTGTERGKDNFGPYTAKLIVEYAKNATEDDEWCTRNMREYNLPGKVLVRRAPDGETKYFRLHRLNGGLNAAYAITKEGLVLFGRQVAFLRIGDHYATTIPLSEYSVMRLDFSTRDLADNDLAKIFSTVERNVRDWMRTIDPSQTPWREKPNSCTE